MRYQRVEAIMVQEAKFVARMRPKSEIVLKPNGESEAFSPDVIAVTEAIHNGGKDAHKVPKIDVIRTALELFRIGSKISVPPATNGHVEPSAPPMAVAVIPPVKAVLPPVKAQAPAPVIQPPKPKAKVKVKLEPKPAKPRFKVPAAPVVKAEAVHAPKSVAAPEPTPPAEPVKVVREMPVLERPGDNNNAYNAFISMYSLCLSAHQLCSLFDNQPGKEKRLEILDKLAIEFNKYTTIKGAKEIAKS